MVPFGFGHPPPPLGSAQLHENYTSILKERITLLSSYPWARILPYM